MESKDSTLLPFTNVVKEVQTAQQWLKSSMINDAAPDFYGFKSLIKTNQI